MREGPIRTADAEGSPFAERTRRVFLEKRFRDRMSVSIRSFSWISSRRPRVTRTRWRIFVPSRRFSTIWRYSFFPDFLIRANMGCLLKDTSCIQDITAYVNVKAQISWHYAFDKPPYHDK